MTTVLALETATEACSLAVLNDAGVSQRHEVIPRGHSQRVFGMLDELVPGGNLKAAGIDLIAYGSGPGSFTGLRIAASLAQGLAFSTGLPALGVPTLGALAQTALRTGVVDAGATVLCTIDARINEVYSAIYSYKEGVARLEEGPWALPPGDQAPAYSGSLCAVGSGVRFIDAFPDKLRDRLHLNEPDLLPEARDVAELALARFAAGDSEVPGEISPVYVRDEIGWKKLADQGKPG